MGKENSSSAKDFLNKISAYKHERKQATLQQQLDKQRKEIEEQQENIRLNRIRTDQIAEIKKLSLSVHPELTSFLEIVNEEMLTKKGEIRQFIHNPGLGLSDEDVRKGDFVGVNLKWNIKNRGKEYQEEYDQIIIYQSLSSVLKVFAGLYGQVAEIDKKSPNWESELGNVMVRIFKDDITRYRYIHPSGPLIES